VIDPTTPELPEQDRLELTFAGLDHTVPMLLLPVRIETRFERTSTPGQNESVELLLRIYPDDIHADALVQGLETAESDLGRTFWKAAWADGARDPMDRAFSRLAARLGPFRAAWVLESTRPKNWFRHASDPTTSTSPRFPTAPSRDAASPAKARLLPDRWWVAGYQQDELKFTAWGSTIPKDLSVGPDLGGQSSAPPASWAEFADSQGLTWLRDFDAAVSAGMALRIALDSQLDVDAGLDIFVLGARSGDEPADAADAFAELLAAHHWTHGFDVVRRGTPTNNSDTASSGISLSEPDLVALLDTVLTKAEATDSSKTPLYRRKAADALGRASATVTITMSGYPPITVEGETGYVH